MENFSYEQIEVKNDVDSVTRGKPIFFLLEITLIFIL